MRLCVAAAVVAVVVAACLVSAAWGKQDLLAAGGSAAPPVYGITVKQTRPHDPQAFTQGLLVSDGALYESIGMYQESAVRKTTFDGQVLQNEKLADSFFAEGLCKKGNMLYQLTWRENVVFARDVTTLKEVAQYRINTEGWGITHDGQHFVVTDGSEKLFFYDDNFNLVNTITVTSGGRPVRQLNELEIVQGNLFANIWGSDLIAAINLQTGAVVYWMDARPLKSYIAGCVTCDVLNGIAYDAAADRLFLTGKRWPLLFEVAVNPTPLSPAQAVDPLSSITRFFT